jgi:hypothetical protein
LRANAKLNRCFELRLPPGRESTQSRNTLSTDSPGFAGFSDLRK